MRLSIRGSAKKRENNFVLLCPKPFVPPTPVYTESQHENLCLIASEAVESILVLEVNAFAMAFSWGKLKTQILLDV